MGRLEEDEQRFVIARAPLRISLAGGGTDVLSYARRWGGLVLGAAIDRYVGVAVYPREFHRRVRIATDTCVLCEHPSDHLDPMIGACLAEVGTDQGLQFATFGDAPSGRGLGGSGAFTVAAVHATGHGEGLSAAELAERASAIEISGLGRSVGKQDHYLAAYGGLRVLHFPPDGHTVVETPSFEPGVVAELEHRLLLFDSGTARDAGEVLAEQNLGTIRGDAAVISHLHGIRRIATEAIDCLNRGDVAAIGELIAEHWSLKAKLGARVSTARAEQLLRTAQDAGGGGGKLLGSGGGGFLLIYCEPAHHQELRRAMAEAGSTELTFRFTTSGSQVAELPL
ncbi:hypothetical protein ABT324_26500 [Saccharopolyspora sp. NPDC000359]|uniref:GHMP family kinase ATP-binding protein n=1 Tax=Saccharopolyspora sp. NPDC000359 TaxID=3154251 RepID=UPI0033285D01